ncbi:hypothetical protein FEK35_28220 [Nocardia cyriacigeorgica]|uniref:Uncharacterized protein n=1 Tax=Nocardia cyriacigeorgica TaxID=135487 RepID=A0A5R8P5T4_9NOCA|nr:hypothetical protein [Nocardia cyriacigeorgica]TLF96638.1 hypothetical protein FEK35_28220 [Nocardia cyriacigeorgica]
MREAELSAYHEIFTRPSNGERDILGDIQKIVGKNPEKSARGSSDFLFDPGLSVLDVAMSHDYDDDYGIAFSKYPIAITVRDVKYNKQQEESSARKLFEALHKGGDYTGILVYDLRRLLAEK